MELRRDLLVSVGILVGLNVLLAFGAIGLFGRMGPAIERVMIENVASLEHAEEMLVVLAEARTASVSAARRQTFDRALAAAQGNITLPDEAAILQDIERLRGDLFRGETAKRSELVHKIRALITANRSAMESANRGARRLGNAGAWTSVFIASLSFLLSALTIRRLRRRVIEPVAELHATLEAARAGDHHRRCKTSDAPVELRIVMQSVNSLLDATSIPR